VAREAGALVHGVHIVTTCALFKVADRRNLPSGDRGRGYCDAGCKRPHPRDMTPPKSLPSLLGPCDLAEHDLTKDPRQRFRPRVRQRLARALDGLPGEGLLSAERLPVGQHQSGTDHDRSASSLRFGQDRRRQRVVTCGVVGRSDATL
jgi:hypothetical protein